MGVRLEEAWLLWVWEGGGCESSRGDVGKKDETWRSTCRPLCMYLLCYISSFLTTFLQIGRCGVQGGFWEAGAGAVVTDPGKNTQRYLSGRGEAVSKISH